MVEKVTPRQTDFIERWSNIVQAIALAVMVGIGAWILGQTVELRVKVERLTVVVETGTAQAAQIGAKLDELSRRLREIEVNGSNGNGPPK